MRDDSPSYECVDHNTKSNMVLHIFIQFLASEDALDNWLSAVLANLETHNVRDTSRTHNWHRANRFIISSSFLYDQTDQPLPYWNELEDKWYDIAEILRDKLNEPAHSGQ